MSTTSVVPPRSERNPKSNVNPLAEAYKGFLRGIEIVFTPQTVFLLGAVVQGLLVLLLPQKYALSPALFLLVFHSLDTFLVSMGLKANPYLKGIYPKKTSAQVLDTEGNYAGPGQEKIAVLLLGTKVNHPLGIFAPDFMKVQEYFGTMQKELTAPDSQETGYLGGSSWVGKDANGAQELLTISYWRSLDDVHRYAHGPSHKKAWLWWDRTLGQHGHIGFMHEVFEAPRAMWESVYINWQPTLLGATSYMKEVEGAGGEKSHEWVSGLMDANRGLLRTSLGRRGHIGGSADKDAFEKNYYVD